MRATDAHYMHRALQLAEKALGQTSPNPMVGAVIVSGKKVVGEGYHRRAGTDHAEIVALKNAGKRAKGATLYVTLEPCCHHGRTGPCTEAIIRAGIKRVIYAMRDPNPKVAGKGLKILRKAGIQVEGPICEDEARHLNRSFSHWVSTGMPWVIAKVAITLDGKVADYRGQARWITNTETRAFVHQLRQFVDGIMVGRGTALRDDPDLTARTQSPTLKHPIPVVCDTHAQLPVRLKLFKENRPQPTIAIVGKKPRSRYQNAIEKQGHEVLVAGLKGRHLHLRKALAKLGARGMTTLLVEGGPTLLAALAKEGLIHEWVICLAPKFLGGKAIGLGDALPQVKMAQAHELTIRRVLPMGNNVVIIVS